MGETRNGKSVSGNTILGEKSFEDVPGQMGVTREVKVATAVRDGYHLTVCDTQGFCDRQVSMQDIIVGMYYALNRLENEVNAILITVRGDTSYSGEEHSAINTWKQIFGDNFMNYVIFCITRLDTADMSLVQFLDTADPSFKALIKEALGL